MGRVWGPDAVAKNDSTSFYGSIVALAESPMVEGLIYAGTDDGLIQVTEDGGQHWRKIETFPFTNTPEHVYVSDVETSRHDPNTVYACLDNDQPGAILPVKQALLYIPADPLGMGGKAFQGDSFYTAPNPPYGATFTFYLKEALKTRKATRREKESRLEREGKVVGYPSWEELR